MSTFAYQIDDGPSIYSGLDGEGYAWNVFGIANTRAVEEEEATPSSVIELRMSKVLELKLRLPSDYKKYYGTAFLIGQVINDPTINQQTIPITLHNLLSLDYLYDHVHLTPLQQFVKSSLGEKYDADDEGSREALRRGLLIQINGMADLLFTNHNPKTVKVVIRIEVSVPRKCNEQQLKLRMTEEAIKLKLESAPDLDTDFKIMQFEAIEDLEQESCAICLKKLLSGVYLQLLPCSHVFHRNCIAPWLVEQYTCPTCRFLVPDIIYCKH